MMQATLMYRLMCRLSFAALVSALGVEAASAADQGASETETSVAVSPPGATSRAQARAEGEAREHYARGVQLHRQQDHAMALAEFERAYALGRNPRLLFTLGQVHYELRQYAQAMLNLSAYLEWGASRVPVARQAQVRRQLEFLRSKVGYVNLRLNVAGARISVDGRFAGVSPLPRPLPLDVGNHLVTATRADSPPAALRLRIESGEVTHAALDLSPPPPESGDALEKAAWITSGGLGALALAGLVATAIDFRHYKDARRTLQEGDPESTRRELDGQRARVNALALATDLLAAAALVSTGIAVYVSWRAPDLQPRTEAWQGAPRDAATHELIVQLDF